MAAPTKALSLYFHSFCYWKLKSINSWSWTVDRSHTQSIFQLSFHFLEELQLKVESQIPSSTWKILITLGNSRGSFPHEFHLYFQRSYNEQVYPRIQNMSSQFLKMHYFCDVNIKEKEPSLPWFTYSYMMLWIPGSDPLIKSVTTQ